MKKQRTLVLFGLVVVIALGLMANPAHARAGKTTFTALEATCSIAPGARWTSGNVLHIRGEVDTKRIASTEPLVNGSNTVVVNVDLNMVNGEGAGWGTFSLQPDQVKGTWEGSYSVSFTAGVYAGQGEAQGRGALSGMKLRASSQQIAIPPNQPCSPGPALDADSISGIILDPRGN